MHVFGSKRMENHWMLGGWREEGERENDFNGRIRDRERKGEKRHWREAKKCKVLFRDLVVVYNSSYSAGHLPYFTLGSRYHSHLIP